jgi:hypothetical protein
VWSSWKKDQSEESELEQKKSRKREAARMKGDMLYRKAKNESNQTKIARCGAQ